MTAQRGPFAGIRVVELGQFVAVPYCGQLLADAGADVIKVEPLQGDATRLNTPIAPGFGRQFVNKNRGKRSLAVDLRHPEALAAVRALALKADVLIVNLRPGDAAEMGLDYESLAADNPGLVYAENTAFGESGPRRGYPGMDGIVQAYAGMDVLTAEGPVHPGEPYVDYAAALILSWAVAAALYYRERAGRGQRVTTSLFQAGMVLQNNSLNSVEIADGDRRERLAALASAVASGADWREVIALRDGSRDAGPARPYHGLFRTADGVIAIAGGGRGSQRRTLDLLGLEDDWLLDPSRPPVDPRAYVRERRRLVEELISRRTTAHWLEAMTAVGIPCAPLQLKEQVLEDEQAWENGYLLKMRHEDLGQLTLVAPPARFSETPLSAGPPPPRLGAHTEEVLQETGLSREAVERLRGLGAVR